MGITVKNAEGSPRSLQIDAMKMCPPVGAMYAAFGVHACLPMSHGASGCCRFQRMELAKHFNRIVHVSSTLCDENAAIFGGQDNLTDAIENAFRAYAPQVIAVHSTCMTETIGDDMAGIIRDVPVPEGAHVVQASTPGYAGMQLSGYSAMTEAFIRQLAVPVEQREGELALIAGWMNPSDLEVVKRYADGFFQQVTMFPDQRGVMDRAPSRDERAYLDGGTRAERIAGISGASAVIALGAEAAWAGGDAVVEVAREQGRDLAAARIALPIGIDATDRFVEALADLSGTPVPKEVVDARAACVEKVMALHPRLFGKRVVLMTDADIAAPLAGYLAGIGMKPVYVGVGWAGDGFVDRVASEVEPYDKDGELDVTVNPRADRYDVEQWLGEHPADMIIGDTRAKMLARRFDIPLVRIGFPIVDRPLSYLVPIVGYEGALHLLRMVLCALAERDEEGVRAEDLSIAETF